MEFGLGREPRFKRNRLMLRSVLLAGTELPQRQGHGREAQDCAVEEVQRMADRERRSQGLAAPNVLHAPPSPARRSKRVVLSPTAATAAAAAAAAAVGG